MTTQRPNPKTKGPKPRTVIYNDQEVTFKELAKLTKRSRSYLINVWNHQEPPRPRVFTDEMMPKLSYKSRGLTFNGVPCSSQDIMRQCSCSDRMVLDRIKTFGMTLTSEHMKPKLNLQKNGPPTNPTAKDRNYQAVTPRERAKLNAIPSPSDFERELWGYK